MGPKALIFIHSLARKSLTKGQGSGITKIPSAMQAEAKASEIFTNLVEAGLKPEMMDDFIKSEADVAKYLNILDAYKRERMKPIPADSPRGREITEALFGKRGEVVDMKGNVIPEGSGIMGGESIESLMKSGDVTKGTVTKKSKKVTDRDMFRAANENYITDTISKIKSMDPIEAMKEANKVIKREGPYKNLNQQQAKKILEDTEDHIFERDVTPMDEDFAAGGRVGLKGGGADMGAGSSKSSKSSGPAGGASSGGNYGGNNSKSDPDDNREQYGAQGQYQRPPSQQERNNQAAVREAQAFNQKKEETIKSVGSGALTAGSLFPRYIDNFQYAAPPGTNINKLRNLARQTASDKSIIDLLKNVYNDPDKFDPDFKRGSQIKASYPQYVKEGILSATGFKPTSQIGGGTNAARALLEKIGSIPGAQTLGRVLPGVGTVSGIYDVGSRLSKGDYFGAGLGALSAIPFVGIPAAAAQAAYDYREPLIEKSTNFFNKLQGAGQYQTGGVAGLLGERTGYAQGTDVFRRQKKEIPEEIKKKIFEMIMGTRNLGKVIENSERTKSRIGSEGVKAYGLAEGGRTGYKEGFTAKQFKRQETENLAAKINEYFDIKGSGSISGKNQIMGAPDGITANTETFNAIINMDIPIIEKINLLGSLGYGKDRFKVEKGDEELFLGEGGYKDRNIGLGFNQGGEGLSGSVIRNLETGDNDYQVKFLKKFESGGRVGLKGGGKTITLMDGTKVYIPEGSTTSSGGLKDRIYSSSKGDLLREDIVRLMSFESGGRVGLRGGGADFIPTEKMNTDRMKVIREFLKRKIPHLDSGPIDKSILYDLQEALSSGSGLFPGYDVRNDLPREVEAKGGGRIGLAGGMTRRAFLKLMGGVAAGIGAIKSGIMGVGKKGVAKKVVKEVIKTPPVAGKPEWFDALINKVILEGDDVTKKLATKDREIVHTKKLNDQESVTVTQDLDDGAIRVEYDSPDNLGQEPVMMQFKPGMADETTGGKKPADRFDVVETEPRYTGPDNTDIEFIGESGGPNISFIESDVTNLKTFATGKGPTMKEIVKSKKRKDLTRAVNENDYEAAEYLGGKYGDVPEPDFPDDYSGYASGGIAGMLGE
jgi:hypothetical protein